MRNAGNRRLMPWVRQRTIFGVPDVGELYTCRGQNWLLSSYFPVWWPGVLPEWYWVGCGERGERVSGSECTVTVEVRSSLSRLLRGRLGVRRGLRGAFVEL